VGFGKADASEFTALGLIINALNGKSPEAQALPTDTIAYSPAAAHFRRLTIAETLHRPAEGGTNHVFAAQCQPLTANLHGLSGLQYALRCGRVVAPKPVQVGR
jgi:hypothetical protein